MIKNHITYNPFSDWQFAFAKAKESYIWDDRGTKYIDFTSGWNVTNLGWNHPDIQKAMLQQVRKNMYAPMWTSDPMQEQYAKTLLSYMPTGIDVVCRATGGTEANEMAIKIARAATGRKKIIGFKDTYHGQLFAALALGASASDTAEIAPLVSQFIQLEYPKTTQNAKEDEKKLALFAEMLDKTLRDRDVAAMVCEPEMVTGWGSCWVGVPGLIKTIRELTTKYGTLLVLDEVGTGFSRTGKLFGFQHSGVIPDMLTFAKGISNGGAAIGAVVTTSAILAPVQSQTHLISTFGWTPVACAAANATLQTHVREKTWEMAERKGEVIRIMLQQELKHTGLVKDIRGLGMEIGLEFTDNLASKVAEHAMKHGLHTVMGGSAILQLMPPLTIPDDILAKGLEILISSVKR